MDTVTVCIVCMTVMGLALIWQSAKSQRTITILSGANHRAVERERRDKMAAEERATELATVAEVPQLAASIAGLHSHEREHRVELEASLDRASIDKPPRKPPAQQPPKPPRASADPDSAAYS